MTLRHENVGPVAEPAVPTSYDRIAYPSAVFARIDPDRIAAIARLHGVPAPPVPTARVLEIGGGDGLNLAAFAAAFPDATCLSLDLAATPVARGQALVRAAGLANVRIERMDILDAARSLPGEYDYVIAHGVYAWVPAPVREAVFALIGRVLAPGGVALVSYNAMPGGLLGQALRDMIGAAVMDDTDRGTGHEIGDEARLADSLALLRAYGEGETTDDNFLVVALRRRARDLATRQPAMLAHDELGAYFEPQALGAVAAAARAAGLAYLNDAGRLAVEEGFGGIEDEAASIRSMQLNDYRTGCFFRHSLFVRRGVPIARRLDPARVADLWLSSSARMTEPGKFVCAHGPFEIGDARMSAILVEAERRYPQRLPLAGMDPERLEAFAHLFLNSAVKLATGPARAVPASERPRLSPLARAQIERGDPGIASLEQSMSTPSEDIRRFFLLIDGSRDVTALAAAAGIGSAEATALVGFAATGAMLVA